MYGPIVLAADLGRTEQGQNEVAVPYLEGDFSDNIDKYLEPVDGKSLTFITKNVGRPDDFVLRPLFQLNDRYYTVYIDFQDTTGTADEEISDTPTIADVAEH